MVLLHIKTPLLDRICAVSLYPKVRNSPHVIIVRHEKYWQFRLRKYVEKIDKRLGVALN